MENKQNANTKKLHNRNRLYELKLLFGTRKYGAREEHAIRKISREIRRARGVKGVINCE